jgi:hypothetical protein
VQKPHPPILVGGAGQYTLKRVIDYGDEWMPIPERGGRLDDRIQELNQMAEEAGRGPIPVSCFGTQPRPEIIERFRGMGVHRCVFFLPPVAKDEALLLLDRYHNVCDEFARAGA